MSDTISHRLRAMGIPDDLIATATVKGKPLSEIDKPKVSRDRMTVLPNGGLEFIVFGAPIGKPRMTQRDKWKKRKCVLQYREWCDRVRRLVDGHVPSPELVEDLNWTAYFEPPISWPKKRRVAAMGQRHRKVPDRDNIDKAVLDCLFKNDSAIATGRIEKWWDWRARLEVQIILG
ncbi:MAG: RusA family crossover junction endodeoxyribonuclease [Planctomycetes bacterium]|nr:RusA family crossover junction endodeoxyribonuclease [Planctomycetota bacterium]